MQNVGQPATAQEATPLEQIESRVIDEGSILHNIDERLYSLLSKLRGSLPESVSDENEKSCPQGTVGSIREKVESNTSLATRIQTSVTELGKLL